MPMTTSTNNVNIKSYSIVIFVITSIVALGVLLLYSTASAKVATPTLLSSNTDKSSSSSLSSTDETFSSDSSSQQQPFSKAQLYNYNFSELDEYFGIKTNWIKTKQNNNNYTLEDRVTKLPLAMSMRQFSNPNFTTTFKRTKMELSCTIALLATRNCFPWNETFVECVTRLGGQSVLEKILPARCTDTYFWWNTLRKELLPHQQQKSSIVGSMMMLKRSSSSWKSLNRGPVWDSTVYEHSIPIQQQFPFIPPNQRHIAPFLPSRSPSVTNLGGGGGRPRRCIPCNMYPIGFGFPLSLFEKRVPRTKVFDFMPLRPKPTPSSGKYEAKITEEDFFHELYAQSFFGLAHIRGGSDQMRIYETIAAGCGLYYWDLDKVAENTLSHLPKKLILMMMNMSGVSHMKKNSNNYVYGRSIFGGTNFIANGDINRRKFNVTEYYELADTLLDYGRKYLTTRAVASYVLDVLNAENARKILIFGTGGTDYLELTLQHGFADLGLEVTVVSRKERHEFIRMQKKRPEKTRKERDDWLSSFQDDSYGSGFGYSMKMNPHLQKTEISYMGIKNKMRMGYFDVVLLQLDGNNFYVLDQILDKQKTKVGFLQYRDSNIVEPHYTTVRACKKEAGPVFIREMKDHGRCS